MERDNVSFLRTLADFYEAHPTTPSPTFYSWDNNVHIYLGVAGAKEYLQTIGSFEKIFSGEVFTAVKRLSNGVVLNFNTDRTSVCRKVVKGTKIVPETYVPGTEGRIEPEHEVEVVEWVCDEPILAKEVTVPEDEDTIPF